jgi:hypothetical protein
MNVDYAISSAFVNLHPKIGQFQFCAKKTNDMWIARDTIHVYVFYFSHRSHGVIFWDRIFGCITYNINYVHELFYFFTHGSETCNNGVHPQLVAEYLLSNKVTKIRSLQINHGERQGCNKYQEEFFSLKSIASIYVHHQPRHNGATTCSTNLQYKRIPYKVHLINIC